MSIIHGHTECPKCHYSIADTLTIENGIGTYSASETFCGLCGTGFEPEDFHANPAQA